MDLEKSETFPFLNIFVRKGKTILTVMTKSSKGTDIARVVRLFIRLNGPSRVYNEDIERNLNKMLMRQIDMKDYFSSDMAIIKLPDFMNFTLTQAIENRIGSKYKDEDGITNMLQEYLSSRVDTIQRGAQIKNDFYVIDMRQSLAGEDKQNFMKIINYAADFDIHYLSIRPLQEIINFKWETFTKRFFMLQLLLLIGFLVSFLADIVSMGPPDANLDI